MPAATPVTTPEEFTVAIADEPELHVPPAVASDNEIVLPWQTTAPPAIVAGAGLMVTVATAVHPVDSV